MYHANKINKEFLEVCGYLQLDDMFLRKEEFFEVLVRFGYLKPIDLISSTFVAK